MIHNTRKFTRSDFIILKLDIVFKDGMMGMINHHKRIKTCKFTLKKTYHFVKHCYACDLYEQNKWENLFFKKRHAQGVTPIQMINIIINFTKLRLLNDIKDFSFSEVHSNKSWLIQLSHFNELSLNERVSH